MNEPITVTEQTAFAAPTMPAAPDAQPFDKEAWAAKKKEQRQALHDLADAATAQAGKDFAMMRQYLAVQARFDRYSVTNAMLVAAQCPTATRLGDFDYWRKRGASVVHGARAISIFEPGKAYNRSDGNVGHSFNVKRVFDISQTTADPRTAPQKPDYRRILTGLLASSPVQVQPTETMPDARDCVYDAQNGVIYARKGLTGEHLCRNLAYTVAMARLTRQREQPANPEFAARAAAFMLYQRYGIPNTGLGDSCKPAEFEGMAPKEVRGQLDTIRRVANDMSFQISRALKPMQKDGPQEEAR